MKTVGARGRIFAITKGAFVGLIIAYCAILAAIVVVIKNTLDIQSSSHKADRKLCALSIDNRNVLRKLLLTAQRNSIITLKRDPERLREALKAYKSLLAVVPPIGICKEIK